MNIAVYCGSASGNRPSFTEGAKALGSWIAQNGHTLVYGGSRTGLMGATADAVLAGGGKVIGVIPDVKLIQERRHPGGAEGHESRLLYQTDRAGGRSCGELWGAPGN